MCRARALHPSSVILEVLLLRIQPPSFFVPSRKATAADERELNLLPAPRGWRGIEAGGRRGAVEPPAKLDRPLRVKPDFHPTI